MKAKSLKVAAAAGTFAGLMALAAPAMASVTFDPANGSGFVGKGEVQTVSSWNNKALQENASTVDFRVNSATQISWTCTKIVVEGNDEIREIVQHRSTTRTTKGLVTTVARDNSKGKDGPVTGFYLRGYEGSAVVGADGPAPGSCPADPSGFVYDGNAVTTVSGGGLQVTHDGTNWYGIG